MREGREGNKKDPEGKLKIIYGKNQGKDPEESN